MAGLPLFDRIDEANDARVPLLSVTELTAMVREVLETGFSQVGVRGEVSNLSRPRSGHVYFLIKDEGASCRAVLWRRDAERLAFELEDGLAIRAFGGLTLYAPKGEYQLTVRKIEPEGIGVLELAFRQVVARLGAEGLFDPDRKRPLPAYPRRIVIVTSPTGAAVRDLLQVLGRRWPGAEILIAPTRVQGDGAASEIVSAIALANRVAGADFVIVARGGGSLEDLWPFNEEIVARAIFDSRLPVVSAIGHEVDVTVADLVADRRALTPSEAGEISVPDLQSVLSTLESLRNRLVRGLNLPIRRASDRISSLSDRADRAIRRDLDRRRDRLARLAASLDALSPLAVLARGYSLTLKGEVVVRSPLDVRPGDLISTRLASGSIVSRVEAEIIGESAS